MAVVLYTRRLPKFEDTLDELPMQNQVNYSQPPSISYPPVVRIQAPSRQSNGSRDHGSRPPSVTASRTGSRQGKHTANVLSVKNADVCLRSKSKSNHWLFIHLFVGDWLQIFLCCFYINSTAESTGK